VTRREGASSTTAENDDVPAREVKQASAVHGFVKPGFERVLQEFERNFTQRGDLGAAFAVSIDGEAVVDLWGGLAASEPPSRPWAQDTLQLIFSGTKGLTAVCVLMLLDRGQISLEDPVCKHWPEFAVGGKEHVTVAEVVSHRARLPGVLHRLCEEDLADDRRMAELLCKQTLESDERARGIYRPLTYGWLCGELVRRVDGRSIGQMFAQDIADPLGLEIWIGLPEALEPRVSTLVYASDWDTPWSHDGLAHDALLACVYGNPPILTAGRMPWNTRLFHAAEIPAVNAIGTARSIARLFSCLACDGRLGGTRLMRPETMKLARRQLCDFIDPIAGEPHAYGVGLNLQTARATYGPPRDAFGADGAGGSVHGAWPGYRLGFSYVMNEMRSGDDPRCRELLNALHAALLTGRHAAISSCTRR
jgi:CubicO group peptidase (beta-lactamase class C family)